MGYWIIKSGIQKARRTQTIDSRTNPRHSHPMAYMNQNYRDANVIAKYLKERIICDSVSDKDRALMAAQWNGLQQLKRLMRGLPPLKAVSLKEVMDAKKSSMKEAAASIDVCTEAETIPDDSTTTVTAPPTP